MAKTLHSRHNKIFLDKLRKLRTSRSLRQADLALLLGRTQNRVSNVERGQTRLDIIELREWLDALNYGFLRFLKELDADLRRLDASRVRGVPRRRALAARSPLSQLIHVGLAFDVPSGARAPTGKGAKGQKPG
jgi:transcriptional regulator with XRE-family HTH domain